MTFYGITETYLEPSLTSNQEPKAVSYFYVVNSLRKIFILDV